MTFKRENPTDEYTCDGCGMAAGKKRRDLMQHLCARVTYTRNCERCGETLRRRSLESTPDYQLRTTCGQACKSKRAPVVIDGWTIVHGIRIWDEADFPALSDKELKPYRKQAKP